MADATIWAKYPRARRQLLNYINAHDDALLRILEQDGDLKEQKLTLAEALKDEDIVSEQVTRRLKALLCHNLPKVNALYRIAARVDIFPTKPSRAPLRGVPIRHDCVHRNGNDKDGAPRNEVTRKLLFARSRRALRRSSITLRHWLKTSRPRLRTH